MFYFVLVITFFLSTTATADDACSWRKLYGNSYWDSRAPKSTPEGRVRLKLESHPRYLSLSQKQKLSVAEKAEKKALERGLTDRHAELIGLREVGMLTLNQKLELSAYDATDGNVEAGRLAQKVTQLDAIERARYEALIKTRGDFRAAFLAEQKARGILKNKAEVAELHALLKSKGDKRFADLKRAQAMGQKQTACDSQEMAYIENAVDTGTQEAKADRLPAIVSPSGGTQNAEGGG